MGEDLQSSDFAALLLTHFVTKEGLEPPRLSTSVPKTDAATITPLGHLASPIGLEPIFFG